MKKMLLITNPVAGKLASRTELFDIVYTFCQAGYTVTTEITLSKGHGVKLAENAQKEGYQIVVCCGGDGTLNEVVTGLLKSGSTLPLGYIPTGSTNDFARTLKLSLNPAQAALAIAQENGGTIDIGSFNQKKYFTYIASFGAFSAVAYKASQDAKNALGHLAYLIEGLKDIAHIKPYNITVIADGRTLEGEYIFGSVTNTTSVAGLVRLKSSVVDLRDGLFEVTLVKSPRNPLDLNKIVAGVTNATFDNDMFEFFKAKDIEFHMPKNISWTLDGEKAEGGKIVRISNITNTLTLYI